MRALRSFVPVAACACTLITAGPAMGADIQTSPGLPDLDVRTGHIAPTAAQRADAKAMRAEVAWNDFGTPSSLVRPRRRARRQDRRRDGGGRGPHMARAQQGAVQAELDREPRAGERLQAGRHRRPRGEPAPDVRRARRLRRRARDPRRHEGRRLEGRLRHLDDQRRRDARRRSRSSRRSRRGSGPPRTSARRARCARSTALAPPSRSRAAGRASSVAGIADVQRTRAVAFPTVADGFVPAFETLVVDSSGGEPLAYRVFIDARSGSGARPREPGRQRARPTPRRPGPPPGPAPVTTPHGDAAGENGGCDAQKGPYTVAAGDDVRAIDVFADADMPSQRHRAEAVPRRRPLGRPGGHRPHARAHPLRAGRRRPAGRLLRPGLRLRR